MTQRRLLLIDDDPVFGETLARTLSRRGFDVQWVGNRAAALLHSSRGAFTDITVDLNLGEDSGLSLIAPLRQAHPHARILVLTGYASIATTVQAMKLGANNVLAKPAGAADIVQALNDDGPEQAGSGDEPDLQPMSVSRLEWEHIARVLHEHGGNVSATARALNMHRRTLQRKLAKKPVQR
ncbi:response regulator [Limnobacter humi]|uniref:Response regulator n=1 Tax=Limnobacter humi TaxID=1778671 RepID=A0ABT1WE07_9BURK|nr:response regulator [Limnobacter humi]MCQ8895750.1 response regulator [Limnobacter humi]